MHRRHIPHRTCIGCRQIRPKRELVRIVRTPDNTTEIDETGKRSGRGAYLCRNPQCWQDALTKGRLEHALKTSMGEKDKAALGRFSQSLMKDGGRPSLPSGVQ